MFLDDIYIYTLFVDEKAVYHGCFFGEKLTEEFIVAWPFFGQLHTSFISDLLDRSEMHRLVRAFDLLPGR